MVEVNDPIKFGFPFFLEKEQACFAETGWTCPSQGLLSISKKPRPNKDPLLNC